MVGFNNKLECSVGRETMIPKLFDGKNRSTKRVAMVGLVVVMLMVAGCGGGGGGGDNGTNGTNGTAAVDNATTTAGSAETTTAGGEETTTAGGMTNETTTGNASMTETTEGSVVNETTTESAGTNATTTGNASTNTTTTESAGANATTSGNATSGNASTNATPSGNASTNATATSGLDLNATPSGPNDDQFFLDRLELLVTQSNHTVNSIGMEGDTVTLEYVTNATNETAALQEMGLISGGYAGLMTGGWNTEGMNVTAVSSAGEPVRTFHIESSWAQQYNNEEISATEYIQLVRETSETASNGNGTAAMIAGASA
jgi:hypothetical protein